MCTRSHTNTQSVQPPPPSSRESSGKRASVGVQGNGHAHPGSEACVTESGRGGRGAGRGGRGGNRGGGGRRGSAKQQGGASEAAAEDEEVRDC
jgi:hypothetical protein